MPSAPVVPMSHSPRSDEDEDEEAKHATQIGAVPNDDDEDDDSNKYEDGSDSDDSQDLGDLVLSKHHEEKKRRKLKRLEANQKSSRNFGKARQDIKDRVIQEVLNEIMPDIGHYDIDMPEVDSGKKCYDPLIRFGKFIGLLNLGLHEAVLSGSEGHLERTVEKIHAGKKSNRALLSQYDARGCTALSLAAKTNQIAMAQILIARHVDVDVPDMETGCTPLFYAARLGNTEMVRVLLLAGGNPSFGDYHNKTPLMMAASKDDYKSIQTMLDPRIVKNHFVEIDSPDSLGWTALHHAAFGNCPKACKTLILEGADRHKKDRAGRSPYQVAQFLNSTKGGWDGCIVQLEDLKARLAALD